MSLTNLPADVSRKILNYLDDEDLNNVCSSGDDISGKICNDGFWINKLLNKFPLSLEEIREGMSKLKHIQSYRDYYNELSRLDHVRILSSPEYLNRLDLIKIAIRRGENVIFLGKKEAMMI